MRHLAVGDADAYQTSGRGRDYNRSFGRTTLAGLGIFWRPSSTWNIIAGAPSAPLPGSEKT
jgi:hypothetical protein